MGYKCVVSDLDRTILHHNGIVSPRTKNALNRLADAEIYFVPATGRSLIGLPESIRSIRGIRYAITSNGAAIYDLKTEQPIYSRKLPKEAPMQIFQTVLEEEIFFECFIDGQGFTSEVYYASPKNFGESDDISAYVRKTRKPVPDIKQFILDNAGKIDSISIVGEVEKKEHTMERLKALVPNIYVTAGAPRLIEISDAGSGKHNGLRALAELLSITPQEIMAFGDGDNDSEMLQAAGLGIAVGNATALCKQAADAVIGDFETDSVAMFLEQQIFLEKSH